MLPAEYILLSKFTFCLLPKIFVSLQPTESKMTQEGGKLCSGIFLKKEIAPRQPFVYTRWIHFSMCRLISAFKNTVPTTCSGMYDPEWKARGMYNWDYLFMLLSVSSRSLGFSDSSLLPATPRLQSQLPHGPWLFNQLPSSLESYHSRSGFRYCM